MPTVTNYSNCNCCGGGNVDTPCCVNDLPQTLFATISDRTGGCTCIDAGPFTLTWDGSAWVGTVTGTGCLLNDIEITVSCIGGLCSALVLNSGSFGAVNQSPSTCTCSPLVLVYTTVNGGTVCFGDFTITVTE